MHVSPPADPLTAAIFRPVSLSGADAAGVLHTDGRRYLRGIHEDHAGEMRALLSGGLIDALCARGLFPATGLVESGIPEAMKGYALVLEHDGIHPVTYPREWSFAMVKAAALAFLDIVEECWQRGYSMKDAHLFNFVFRGTTPLWVDIGSFVPQDSVRAPLPWLAEFNAGILAPLRIWADGAAYLARSAIRHPASRFPRDEFYAYRYPALRGPSKLAQRLRRLLAWRRDAASIQDGSPRARLFKALFAERPPAVFGRLRRAVKRLGTPVSSAWGGYQDEYLDAQCGATTSRRFERIVELVARHRPASVLELGGNAGVLSRLLAERMPTTRVMCSDYDAVAIDRFFERAGRAALPNLGGAVLDFMVPEYTQAEAAPHERLAADCVLALAVTHHLLLAQGYDYDTVLARIRDYTTNLAFIEFMPLGLHDGHSAPPLPVWYNLDAFSSVFSRYFERLHVEQLDENRILLVGRAGAARS